MYSRSSRPTGTHVILLYVERIIIVNYILCVYKNIIRPKCKHSVRIPYYKRCQVLSVTDRIRCGSDSKTLNKRPTRERMRQRFIEVL